MTTTTEAPAPEVAAPLVVGQLHMIDPTTALIGTNVRLDPRLDKRFIASIRERGVLVPVVGHLNHEGQFTVLYGQRRTLAAVETGRPEIPAYVVAGQDEADRLIDQMAENDHRAVLTTAEHRSGFEQLAALGLSAAQIAKRTSTPKDEVTAALVVSGSPLASRAVDRWGFLTLEQGAALAEFDDDEKAVEDLVVAAGNGRFAHTLQRLRDAKEEQAMKAALAETLTAAGVTVIAQPGWEVKTTKGLGNLATPDHQKITPEDHATCPGHAAWVAIGWGYVDVFDDDEEHDGEEDYEDEEEDEDDGPQQERVKAAEARYVCVNWSSHGHIDRYGSSSSSSKPKAADMTDEQREQATAERRDVIDSNKAWKSAEVVRREWLTTFLTRKTAPKGTGIFLAGAFLGGHSAHLSDFKVPALRDSILGENPGKLESMTDARAQVVALGHVLAGFESQTGTHSWRSVSPATALYLTFLQTCGYVLSDVEERAVTGKKPKGTTAK